MRSAFMRGFLEKLGSEKIPHGYKSKLHFTRVWRDVYGKGGKSALNLPRPGDISERHQIESRNRLAKKLRTLKSNKGLAAAKRKRDAVRNIGRRLPPTTKD